MTLEQITRQVCADHKVAYREVMSRVQYRSVQLARREAMVAMRRAGVGFEAIGFFFDRDHSSVVAVVNGKRRKAIPTSVDSTPPTPP